MLMMLAKTATIAKPSKQVETVLEYQRTGDKALLEDLIESNVRMVMKIAKSYVRRACPMQDLVSEGTIGIIDAANRYSPDHGANFNTYAQQWIRARVQEYVQKNSSALKIGGRTARTLFSSLARVMRKHGQDVTDELIAQELNLDKAEVVEALRYMNRYGSSLDASIGAEGRTLAELKGCDSPTQEAVLIQREEDDKRATLFTSFGATLNEREQLIYHERMLASSPKGLKELSEIIGVSMERVRQLEKGIMQRLEKAAHKTYRS
jgi:RNA polymerase sigma-32 factor